MADHLALLGYPQIERSQGPGGTERLELAVRILNQVLRLDELQNQVHVEQLLARAQIQRFNGEFRRRQLEQVAIGVVGFQPTADQGHQASGMVVETLQAEHGAVSHVAHLKALLGLLPDQLQFDLLGPGVQLLSGNQLPIEQVCGQRFQLDHSSTAVIRLRPCRARTACWLNAR
ncbi:hypothetical protein D3C76_1363020 [compost metagenome]